MFPWQLAEINMFSFVVVVCIFLTIVVVVVEVLNAYIVIINGLFHIYG